MKYGLIGEHLTHSYSCDIHSLLAEYEYELYELRPDMLCDFLTKRDFCGVNVTIPYKEKVIPYLDEISDIAKMTGAVNTIVNRGGKLYGTNTDYNGMLAMAEKMNIDGHGKKLIILGSGGTSKTAYYVSKSLGAGEIIRVSRSKKDGYISYEEAKEKHFDADYIINTTPVGMFPHINEQPISLDVFKNLRALLDVVYNPLRTDLVLDAERRDINSQGGLYMLAAQAAYAKAEFLDEAVNISDIERAFNKVRSEKENIVLTGMPSSGKTTAGRIIAEKLEKEFVDTDEIIKDRIGMTIPDFFKLRGEKEFRIKENQVINEVSSAGGKVIATGGGAVIDSENIRQLKHNGVIVFLDRNLEKLKATKDRPLSSDREALYDLYKERYDIYLNAADIKIDGNGTLDEVSTNIIKALNSRD